LARRRHRGGCHQPTAVQITIDNADVGARALQRGEQLLPGRAVGDDLQAGLGERLLKDRPRFLTAGDQDPNLAPS